jgi:hypothetical protein
MCHMAEGLLSCASCTSRSKMPCARCPRVCCLCPAFGRLLAFLCFLVRVLVSQRSSLRARSCVCVCVRVCVCACVCYGSEEEDTCVCYGSEEEDTCVCYGSEEEDTCVCYGSEEEDKCVCYGSEAATSAASCVCVCSRDSAATSAASSLIQDATHQNPVVCERERVQCICENMFSQMHYRNTWHVTGSRHQLRHGSGHVDAPLQVLLQDMRQCCHTA